SYTPGASAQTSTLISDGLVGTTSVTGVGLEVLGGQLYITSSSGAALKLGTVGTGAPVTGPQTITSVPNIPLGTGNVPKFPVDVLGPDLSPTNGFLPTPIDTLYIADDGAGFTGGTITKWTWSNATSTWTNSGTITAALGTNGVVTFYWLQGQVVAG